MEYLIILGERIPNKLLIFSILYAFQLINYFKGFDMNLRGIYTVNKNNKKIIAYNSIQQDGF